jgi:hypothetical protein
MFLDLPLPLHELPAIFSLSVHTPWGPDGPVYVSILLKSYRRADVAKWAAHFGTEVTEGEPRRLYEGAPWERPVETVYETRGFRVSVRTTVPVKAPAPVGGAA